MPEDAKQLLVQSIDNFCTLRLHTKRISRSLCCCQALAGHVNWALNIFPHL